MTETSRTTDSVEIGFSCSGEIKVDDDVDGLDVDTASEKIGADEVAGHAVAEIVEDAVPVGLKHFRVRVETRVAELGDLLGEELDPVGRVAKNDGLVDLELRRGQRRSLSISDVTYRAEGTPTHLGEESVEAVNLLPFFDVGVILGDTLEGEFFHQVDFVWLHHVSVLRPV